MTFFKSFQSNRTVVQDNASASASTSTSVNNSVELDVAMLDLEKGRSSEIAMVEVSSPSAFSFQLPSLLQGMSGRSVQETSTNPHKRSAEVSIKNNYGIYDTHPFLYVYSLQLKGKYAWWMAPPESMRMSSSD